MSFPKVQLTPEDLTEALMISNALSNWIMNSEA